MRIVHRISINEVPEIRLELARMGIFVGRGDSTASNLVTFEVDESQDVWPTLEAWIIRHGALDIVSTRFTKREVEAARWLELVPSWQQGYPQPNDDVFGFRDATYDLTDYCERCGIGMKQKAPFQMKGEPKWGGKGILQLHWVFDEFFVTPQVWARIFKPNGVGKRAVTDRKGVELETVLQLVVEEEVGTVTDGLPSDTCPICDRTKYLPVAKGPFPPLANEVSSAMVKTKEYFGSGGAADKCVLVSQMIARTLLAEKVRGASLKPVKKSTDRR